LGILDMARLHYDAFAKVPPPASGKRRAHHLRRAGAFFLELLSPFEAAHRGFSELADRLQERNRRLEREIAERRQAQRAAEDSEAQLRGILDHSPAVIFLKDTQGRYLRVNRQFEKSFGIIASQVVGRRDHQLFSRNQASKFLANDRKVLRQGAPMDFEEIARYRDGLHTSIVSKFPVRGPNGRIYALCGVATDITARKRMEEALRQSEERFRLLVSNVKDYAIYMLYPDGRVASWNAGAERIKGWRRDEIIGKHYGRFFTAADLRNRAPRADLEKALRAGRYEGEGWRVRKDGSRFWANVIVTPVRGHAGKLLGFAKVTRDMTERRLADEAWRQLSSKILHAQETERKRISRELHDETGQALTAISVMLAALKHDPAAAASRSVARKVAHTQQLLERTMDSIHHFARELRPAMLDELGLIPALRSHAKTFAQRTGLRVRLIANPVAELLNNDQKTVFFRVAQESLTNVAKHARASRVNLSIYKSAGNLIMEISDNGRSFRDPPDAKNRHSQRLGLLGMQERVRLINGRFVIKPQPGAGTTVCVSVPFAPNKGSGIITGPTRSPLNYGKNSSIVGRRSYGGAAGPQVPARSRR
ncbi:MAG: PAS domain S-box protein, partial [Verrucomicrobia bacterium]|nr:PAS domain S-box protein [Verrucomicrobiota bacterium]